MSTVTPIRPIIGSQLTTSAAVYYTCPTATAVVIKRAIFCNTTSGAITITAYIVPSGGTAGDANTVIKTLSIAADTTYPSPELAGMTLNAGDTVQALASAGASITFMASGITIV